MKSVFRDILIEGEFAQPLRYVPRLQTFATLPHKALAVIGIRRCGKTTFLRQIWDALSSKTTIDSRRLIYINFFDERLYGLQASQLQEILAAHYELYPEHKARQPLFFFLDEIQMVPGWERFVDRLLRGGHHVYVTGSSAALLSRELASAMRGRALSVEMFPFSFEEILRAEKYDTSVRGPRERAAAISRFRTYLKNGGFPETLGVLSSVRRRLLQDYLDAVLLRDIIERHNPSDPSAIMHLSHLLMNQSAGLYTLNKTCERLKAQGLKVNKPEISKALEWFYDSYLYFSVPILAQSVQRQSVNPRKLYCIDTGMMNYQSTGLSDQWGQLLENAVFLHLRRSTDQISYFKDLRQREVDFVVRRANHKFELIQVCATLKNPKTRARELDAVQSAMAELALREATLITLDEKEEIKSTGKIIHVRPAWDYFLKP